MNTDKIYAEHIANEYAPKDASRVNALRKLDARAKLPANVSAYSIGIVSSLVFGLGMSLSMRVIGAGTTASSAFGIVLGVIGMAGMGVNYPIYRKLLEKGKRRYASQIMELARKISET